MSEYCYRLEIQSNKYNPGPPKCNLGIPTSMPLKDGHIYFIYIYINFMSYFNIIFIEL